METESPRRPSVLVADSDPVRSERGARLLHQVGCDVTRSASLSETLSVLATRQDLALVLLDLRLSESAPAGPVEPVHAAAPELPLLVLAPDQDEAAAREAVLAGAREYLLESQLQEAFVLPAVERATGRRMGPPIRPTAERALMEAEWRYRSLFNLCPDAVCVIDADGLIVDANLAALEALDAPDRRLVGRVAEALFARNDDADRFRAALGDAVPLLSGEVALRGPRGSTVETTLSMMPRREADGAPSGAYLFLGGTVTRREAAPVGRRSAFYDPLTGLPNRSLFLDRLGYVIGRRKRHQALLFGVLFVDLDRFKEVNDHFGHAVGDDLLRQVALRLADCVRAEDTAARLGGDEFVVLLPQIENLADATLIADRILQHVARPFDLSGRDMRLSCSIGIAIGSEEAASAEELLREADYAMYRAKSQKPGSYQIYDPAMHARVMELLTLEGELRRAIAQDEFVLFYQPIVDADTTEVRGMEALLRWNHPRRGLLPPSAFIPLAEERGFMEAIGGWVLREVCRQLNEWREHIPHLQGLEVSVNLSAPEFLRPDFVDDLQRLLHEYRVPPDRLRLECAERTLEVDPPATLTTLERLRGLGVRISVDHFTVGSHFWSCLDRRPVDSLKIPRTSLTSAGRGETPAVSQIAHLARCLGMNAVAEGVETSEELETYRAAGTDLAQGYLFWKPLRADEAAALLRERAGGGAPPTVTA